MKSDDGVRRIAGNVLLAADFVTLVGQDGPFDCVKVSARGPTRYLSHFVTLEMIRDAVFAPSWQDPRETALDMLGDMLAGRVR